MGVAYDKYLQYISYTVVVYLISQSLIHVIDINLLHVNLPHGIRRSNLLYETYQGDVFCGRWLSVGSLLLSGRAQAGAYKRSALNKLII